MTEKFIIPLETVEYDSFARGLNCQIPYHGHPKGCPNYPKCIKDRPDFRNIAMNYTWFAVMEVFDLKAHAESAKIKHPQWTERQCRNPRHWQGGVRKRLREKALTLNGDILLDIPEACGVEVFETMKLHGIEIEKHPQIVRKIMLVGMKVKP